jgi:hypothetical protein
MAGCYNTALRNSVLKNAHGGKNHGKKKETDRQSVQPAGRDLSAGKNETGAADAGSTHRRGAASQRTRAPEDDDGRTCGLHGHLARLSRRRGTRPAAIVEPADEKTARPTRDLLRLSSGGDHDQRKHDLPIRPGVGNLHDEPEPEHFIERLHAGRTRLLLQSRAYLSEIHPGKSARTHQDAPEQTDETFRAARAFRRR